jgi:hypothetical protein
MTTGGVYVITELARHLAAAAEVTLVVGKGQHRPIPGVRVIPANGLDPEALPDADVLVGGLAQGTVDQVLGLPARVGTPVFLFMGYGAPGSTAVRLALARRPRVLAIRNSWRPMRGGRAVPSSRSPWVSTATCSLPVGKRRPPPGGGDDLA